MLTDEQARQAKARSAPYGLSDQHGLYLYVSITGAKTWRYDYRLRTKREALTFGQNRDFKRETLTIGRYPDFSLAEARELHARARQLVARGESPAKAKQAEKQAAKEAARAAREARAEARALRPKPARQEVLDKDIPKAIQAVSGKRISEATLGDLLAIATCVKDMWFGERSGAPGEEEGR
jgi:hypothetical protein